MRPRTFTLLTICFTGAVSLAQVPVLLKDINPTGPSSPGFLTCFGNELYFNATDGVNGYEFWKTDGTTAGTVMVKDLVPGSGSGQPQDFMELNGVIYFTATDPVNGVQIWTTDGTEGGTQVVLSLTDVPGLTQWLYFIPFDERIFFRGKDAAHGSELWSTDLTAEGTALFMDINPGPVNSAMEDPAVHDGHLYFNAVDATNGAEPWISDGTVAGTHMITNIIPGSPGGDPSDFISVGSQVFFRAETVAQGEELWVTDGTEAGTHLVKDIDLGPNSSLPSFFTEHNGLLYFRAFTSQSDNFIWRSDGTLAGTVALPIPEYGYNLASYFCSHNGWLYFSGFGDFNAQLWRTDDTAEGTQEFLYPGSDVVQPLASQWDKVSCNGDMFFRASYMAATGSELYSLNPSTGIEGQGDHIVQVHPNPATDRIWMDIGEAHAAPATVIVRDLQGRVVLLPSAIAAGGGGHYRVSLDGMAPGIYIIDLKVGEKRWSKRIVKA